MVGISAPRFLTGGLLLAALCACGWESTSSVDEAHVVTFRCIDNNWFTVRPTGRAGEIVVVRPMQIQVRLQKRRAGEGSWRFAGGGYTLSGAGSEAIWVAENRLPIRCTAEKLPKFILKT